MSKIGAHVSSAGGPVNAIKNIQDINGNCLQIFAGSPRMWARTLYSESQVTSFNQKIDELNLRPVFIHALYLVNLASDNKELLQKSFDSLLMDLKNGNLINSAGVVVHVGSHQGRGFDPVKTQVVKQISTLIDQTKTTPFLIENSAGQKGKIGSFEEIKELIDGVNSPRLGICLDTAHLFMSGWDLTDKKQVEVMVQKLTAFGLLEKIICVHLNDSKTKLGSTLDQHANLGEGFIGRDGLKNFVTRPAFKNLPFILEVPGDGNGPDLKNLTVARSLFKGI
jgi:deoxyribonuclease-4